jgi:hypothetical protein
MKVVRVGNSANGACFKDCVQTIRHYCGWSNGFEIFADFGSKPETKVADYFRDHLIKLNDGFKDEVYKNKKLVYENYANLPCILLLCEKGRMGDTFPQSFNCMDLRARGNDSPPFLTGFVQELGRLCRYERPEYQLPVALVGDKVYTKLKGSYHLATSGLAVDE